MKKMLVSVVLGIIIGVSLKPSIEVTNVEVEVVEKKLKNEPLFTKKIVEKNLTHCEICGEMLDEHEKNLCIWCEEFYNGYMKGVEETKKYYNITEVEF